MQARLKNAMHILSSAIQEAFLFEKTFAIIFHSFTYLFLFFLQEANSSDYCGRPLLCSSWGKV